jgi:xanthine dehydrogenase accessory factor
MNTDHINLTLRNRASKEEGLAPAHRNSGSNPHFLTCNLHGQIAALATVVAVEGSSYRRPGARMWISDTGETAGVLSGGCLERDVTERALKVFQTGQPAVVRYDTTNEDDIVWGLGLGCNGIIDILIEPMSVHVRGLMQLLAECSESDRCGAVATVFHVEGDVEVAVGARAGLYPDGTVDGTLEIKPIFEDLRDATTSIVKRYELPGGHVDVFLEVIQPRTRLIIFGAGYDVSPVVDLAKGLGWHTTVVDTNARVSSRERFSNADLVLLCRPENVLDHVKLTERTLVVTMTHNYLHDLELLRNLLQMSLRYIGCLGPRRRTERLLLEVADGDERLAREYLNQLHAPIGLDIGAETAEEIALSMVSEMRAVLSSRTGTQLRERKGTIHETFPAASTLVASSRRTPLDHQRLTA